MNYASDAAYELTSPDAPNLLVLLHGLGGDRQQPLGVLDGVELPAVSVLAPDARGHGETTLLGDRSTFGFDSMAADVVALIAATGQAGKPTYVAGISMGAATALRVASHQSIDARGAAFIRPAFTDRANPPNLAPMRLIADLLDRFGEVEGRLVFEASPEYQALRSVSRVHAESLLDQFAKPQARSRLDRLRYVPTNVAYSGRDPLLAGVPSLVITAPADPVHPTGIARAWAERLPDATAVDVPGRDADPVGYAAGIRRALVDHVKVTLALVGSQVTNR